MPCYTTRKPCVSKEDCQKFINLGTGKIISLYDSIFYQRHKHLFQKYKEHSKNKDKKQLAENLFNYAKRYPVTPIKRVFFEYIKGLPKA